MALGALASVFRRSLSSRRSNRARRILRLAYGRQEMHDGDSGKLMVGGPSASGSAPSAMMIER